MATSSRKRRRRRKKQGRSLFFTIITFLIVIGAIIAAVTVFLKVADIQVSGLTRYDAADVIETSGIKVGDNMFAINKFSVAERILSEYPYIETIKIRRKLPDTFTFEITERVPVAYIKASGNLWLLDSNAYVLEMLPQDTETSFSEIGGVDMVTPHPGFEVVFEKPEQVSSLKEILTALRYTDMADKIRRIEIGKLYDISLVYEDRFLVVLGDSSDVYRKIEMLKAVVAQLSDFDRGTINVSAIKEARFLPNAHIDLSSNSAQEQGGNVPSEAETESPDTSEIEQAEGLETENAA